MTWRVIRMLAGFAGASLSAAVVQVLFVVDAATAVSTTDAAAASGLVVLMAAAQTAIFSAPFALVLIWLSERMALRGWPFFIFGGGLIGLAAYAAAIGWTGSHASAYPLLALVVAGATGGFAFRSVAGVAGTSR